MDVKAIYDFLTNHSYWAKEIPLKTVEVSLRNSFCAGIFTGDKQVGFARLITDYATFAYLADVYILEEHRGKGLSKMLMHYLTDLEWAKGLRRLLLATSDAHSLYTQFGFRSPQDPESLMEIKRNNIYENL